MMFFYVCITSVLVKTYLQSDLISFANNEDDTLRLSSPLCLVQGLQNKVVVKTELMVVVRDRSTQYTVIVVLHL